MIHFLKLSKSIFFVLIIGIFCNAYAQKNNSKLYIIDFDELNKEKNSITNSRDKQAFKEFRDLTKKANKLLDRAVFSVVHKTGSPLSKDKHDYMSIGPYWWSNPITNDGLPYIRRDGEINPESRNNFTDYVEKNDFISAVKILTKAYFFTDDVKYANKNIEFINAWFLNPITKMNPNLNYGQYVPGRSYGRCFGIIEVHRFVEVLKFLELAKERNILDKNIEEGMVNWFTEYVYWLQNSTLGKEGATRKNNHGTYYDIQLLNILLYLNKINMVKKHLATTTKRRIFSQIEPDGRQPLELARTKSFSYSVMNLHGFLELASIGKKVGIDLWNVSSKDGRSLKAGFKYIIPYITNKKHWKYQQIKSTEHSEETLISDLKYIQKHFGDTTFDAVLHELHQKNNDKD